MFGVILGFRSGKEVGMIVTDMTVKRKSIQYKLWDDSLFSYVDEEIAYKHVTELEDYDDVSDYLNNNKRVSFIM
jgi:hypothetical protein